MAEKKTLLKGLFNWTFLAIFIAAIVLVNIISSLINHPIDMTKDQRYSLANGTITYLENKETIKNRLNIRIYLEGNMPAEIRHFRDAIEDKLKEFKSYAGDRIEYEFIDPNLGTEEEKQALYENLYARGKGILPMEVQYMQEGERKSFMLWPGAVLEYGGSTVQSVQFLPGTPVGKAYDLNGLTEIIENSTNNLEYILISSIKRTTQEKKPRLAFLQGHGELTYPQTQRVRSLISPYYNIADVIIRDSVTALNDVDGLIIANPRSHFSGKELYIIDQFVMRGGRLMCFLDALNLNQDSLRINGLTHTTRNETGLENMLYDYGLKINENYVVDANCAPIIVPFAKQTILPWFYHVLASPTSHPITRNIEPVSLEYTNEIQFVGKQDRIAQTPILTSSTNSTVTGLAPLVSLAMPLNYGNNPELVPNPKAESNKRCLAGLSEGFFNSHFRNRIVDEYAKNPVSNHHDESVKEGKVILIGNGRFIANKYDSMPAKDSGQYLYRPKEFNDLRMDEQLLQNNIQIFYGNQEFFQNLVDYMMGDNSVLDIRSRQIDIHQIDKEKVKKDSGFFKVINMILPSLLIILLAIIIQFFRKRKYEKQ